MGWSKKPSYPSTALLDVMMKLATLWQQTISW